MLIPFRKLPTHSIRGIIHLGAHEAEELADYAACGQVKVLWVEANPDKWSILSNKISSYPDMRLGQFAAAPASSGYAVLNVASNSQSSSLLPLGTHANIYPSIKYTREVSVLLRSVDDWIQELAVNSSDYNFVNLDLQGYELCALRGMTDQLRFVDFVYAEVNFGDVYVGCAKISELDEFLLTYGLTRVATIDTGAGWGDAFYSRDPLGLWLNIWMRFRYVLNFPKRSFRRSIRLLRGIS
jgi:FkbM family methyltransferase